MHATAQRREDRTLARLNQQGMGVKSEGNKKEVAVEAAGKPGGSDALLTGCRET